MRFTAADCVARSLARQTICHYIVSMQFVWDEAKRRANIAKHDVDFTHAIQVLYDAPWMEVDDRHEYGETRCLAIGLYLNVMLVVVFTLRDGIFRIISARRANSRERRKYAKAFC
ncbi:BrnT family toxin [Desulfovibrio sp. DV]|uniref:BrnT family toxin n=1 Tax=Desulfovibrio sp. DV TaxID=1844708 RepID=UPI0020C9C04F|nr:BrnT family toxin [Desulfovibrio sp. DV]